MITGPLLILSLLFGGPAGAIVAPIAWGALVNQVPLRRAIMGTATGALLGGVVAGRSVGFVGLAEAGLLATIPGAMIGSVIAIGFLRHRAGRTANSYAKAV